MNHTVPQLFSDYFLTNDQAPPPFAQRDDVPSSVVRCLKCGCTIDEHRSTIDEHPAQRLSVAHGSCDVNDLLFSTLRPKANSLITFGIHTISVDWPTPSCDDCVFTLFPRREIPNVAGSAANVAKASSSSISNASSPKTASQALSNGSAYFPDERPHDIDVTRIGSYLQQQAFLLLSLSLDFTCFKCLSPHQLRLHHTFGWWILHGTKPVLLSRIGSQNMCAGWYDAALLTRCCPNMEIFVVIETESNTRQFLVKGEYKASQHHVHFHYHGPSLDAYKKMKCSFTPDEKSSQESSPDSKNQKEAKKTSKTLPADSKPPKAAKAVDSKLSTEDAEAPGRLSSTSTVCHAVTEQAAERSDAIRLWDTLANPELSISSRGEIAIGGASLSQRTIGAAIDRQWNDFQGFLTEDGVQDCRSDLTGQWYAEIRERLCRK